MSKTDWESNNTWAYLKGTTMRKDSASTPECKCLNCGKRLDAATSAGEQAEPEPGDVTVCFGCGAVMRFDHKLRVRGMTDAEMDELAADKEFMAQVANLVGALHFMRHMQG